MPGSTTSTRSATARSFGWTSSQTVPRRSKPCRCPTRPPPGRPMSEESLDAARGWAPRCFTRRYGWTNGRDSDAGLLGNLSAKGVRVRSIRQADDKVQMQCEACGAEQTARRFTSYPMFGRPRCEPYEGQWIQCKACADWSPLEQHAAVPVPPARSPAAARQPNGASTISTRTPRGLLGLSG